jgi:hypothetical protein
VTSYISENLFDLAWQEIREWLIDTPIELADAIRGGGEGPFAANISETEKLDYYDRLLFLPDGQENAAGREALLERVGMRQFAVVMAEVMKRRRPGLPVGQEPEDGRI